MTMGATQMFSAERRLLEAKRGRNSGDDASSVSNAEVLMTLNKLRAEMMDMARVLAPQHMPAINELREAVQLGKAELAEATAMPESVDVSLEIKASEVKLLKTELRAMTICIEQTKREISGFQTGSEQHDHLEIASLELDAIVNSTERATDTILSSVELIEDISRQIRVISANPHVDSMVDEISATVLKVFEACNFQDITGQRISKVVSTLQYIEQRVRAMVSIWGAEEVFNAAPLLEVVKVKDDRSLLNGPQLNNAGISQDDIDQMFL
jgi:chemotaxis protein CheZ